MRSLSKKVTWSDLDCNRWGSMIEALWGPRESVHEYTLYQNLSETYFIYPQEEITLH